MSIGKTRSPRRDNQRDQLQGTLDLLVLRTLDAGGRLHGYAIADRVEAVSQDVLRIEAGSLYPALHRMTEAGWVTAEWALSENNRRARFYTITAAGRRRLADEEAHWSRLALAVGRVLEARLTVIAMNRLPARALWRRFLNRWREQPLRQEFDEEIAFHLEQRAARNRRAGMDDAAASVEARRHFGNVTLAREDMREARVLGWIDRFSGDVRYGVRVFRRQPMRTAIAILTLSLAIGANTAIFSVLHAVMFRPFPFPDSDRAVLVVERLRSGGGTSPTIPEIIDLRARSRTLEVVTFFDTRDFQVDGGTEPVRVFGARVDPAFLPLVGARPAHGRLFSEADSEENSPGVLLLSDGLWRRNFGADPAVVGRPFIVNGETHTIAGVLAPDFTLSFLSAEPEIYVPYPLIPLYTLRTGEFANVRRVQTLARVAPGISRETVSAELETIAAALANEHPQLYKDFGGAANFVIDAEPLRASIADSPRTSLLMVFGAVILLLLIGCVNVAQHLLSQAIDREPEVALRSALGASRGRLVAQFFSETLVLVGIAAAVGVAQAVWLVQALRSFLPPMLMVGRIELDLTVLAFAGAVAIVTALVCGVLPGLSFSRAALRPSLESRAGTRRRGRARQSLVAVQIALSVVLLVQAAQLIRTLQVWYRAQSGFSADGVTAMRIRGMSAGPSLGVNYAQYLERIAATPGIAAVAMTSSPVPGSAGTAFSLPGRSDSEATRSRQTSTYLIVSPDYFSVLRIPIREGRTFAPTDTVKMTPVAIVNEEMVRRYWSGASPLGQQIRAGGGPRDATMTIIGVVGNVRTIGQTDDAPQVYVSYLQQSEPNMIVLARLRQPSVGQARAQTPTLPIDAIKRAIWSVEPRQAVFAIRPLDEMLSQRLDGGRVIATLISTVAALALAMSMAGVFAVVSYLTSRRHREIALRRAIGAQNSDLIWLLSAQTFRWTLIGLAAGAAGAVLAGRALRAAFAGLADLDAAIVAVLAVAYLAVAGVAMILPALRALRVDPATALRAE